MNYIFDVDGTLSPSRGLMDVEFKQFFLSFIKKHNVYLVTGSDYSKTVEQLGSDITENVVSCFNCAGNSVYKSGKEIWSNDWLIPKEAKLWLEKQLQLSKFSFKTGLHIEERPGMINFSIVGRNCNPEQRALYVKWDTTHSERESIARSFTDKFGISAQVAGETGIDIYPPGADKSQVVEWINKPITFFGDKMQRGGNDFPLAAILEKHSGCSSIQVKDWRDTQRFLFALEYPYVHDYVGVV
jgi:phosphomannomutase